MKNLKLTQPRQIVKLPEAEYRMIDAVSSTDLKMFSESPRKYALYKEGKSETSPSMHFGTMAHMAILEPDLFFQKYVVEPDRMPDGRRAGTDIHRNTKEWKAFISEWALGHSTKIQLSPDEFSRLNKMILAVNTHPIASKLLESHEKEMVALWSDPATGTKCKGKADLVGESLIDFKTIDFQGKPATPWEFEKISYNRSYHAQIAFYDQGFQLSGCNFKSRYVIAVENTKEKAEAVCLVMEVSRELLERGYEINKRLMEKFLECRTKNKWPGFTGVYDLRIPAWATVELEESNGTE